MLIDESPFQYRLIAQEIKDQIFRGEIRPGARLRSERDLGRHFQVQRNTIRQALAVLEKEGRISIEGRRGSYVLPPPPAARGETLLINIHEGSGRHLGALFNGFSRGAEAGGFNVQRRNTDPLPDSALNQIPSPETLPPLTAGLILWPHYPTDTARLRRLNDSVPLVLVDQRVMGVAADCVRFDDITGGRMITHHLLDLGHRRIAFLADEVFADTVQCRWHGYIQAHEDAGVPYDPKLSLLYQQMNFEIFAGTMRHLLSEGENRPTAFVCSNDLVAFALLRFLNAEGLRIPEDVAVTGYGNSTPEFAEAISLTTVDQPFFEVGQEAARLLCERARQTSAERLQSAQDIVLPVRLVIRGSTAGI